MGQKVSTKSWMTAISLSPLREYCYYLVRSSNIRVKGDKIKMENIPIRLPLETWCSLSVPQCAASNKGNWNSWCLYSYANAFFWFGCFGHVNDITSFLRNLTCLNFMMFICYSLVFSCFKLKIIFPQEFSKLCLREITKSTATTRLLAVPF